MYGFAKLCAYHGIWELYSLESIQSKDPAIYLKNSLDICKMAKNIWWQSGNKFISPLTWDRQFSIWSKHQKEFVFKVRNWLLYLGLKQSRLFWLKLIVSDQIFWWQKLDRIDNQSRLLDSIWRSKLEYYQWYTARGQCSLRLLHYCRVHFYSYVSHCTFMLLVKTRYASRVRRKA